MNENKTNEEGSVENLGGLCDNGFGGDVRATALVLGRTDDEIKAMLKGELPIDGDLDFKISGIMEERGISI